MNRRGQQVYNSVATRLRCLLRCWPPDPLDWMEKSPGKFEDVGKDLRLVLPDRLLGRAADGTIVRARFIFERKSLSPHKRVKIKLG